jgi:hypothetical protein
VSRVDFHAVIELEELVVQAVVKHAGHLLGCVTLRAYEVRAAYIADEQGIAREHLLWLIRDFSIYDQHGNGLRRVARRFKDSQGDLPDIDFIAILYCKVRKSRASFLAEYDLRSGAGGKLTMAAHEIGMQVSFNHVLDFEALRFGLGDVQVNITLRVYDRRFALGADEVRSMREAPEIKLFEVHGGSS